MTNIAHAIPLSAKTHSQPASGVTELVLTSDSPEQLALLLPMIAFLSNVSSDRWITWIAPHNINRELLESYGVNTRYIRVIHCQDPQTLLWITWEALSAGNSHTVISSPGKLTDKELAQLELAAKNGSSQGLLLRVR
ncbi:cell division inhibitor SulA [Cellvibrio sp. NN19]|uniref:cell division inhibitor SulA n=1 Tax=Cellvibrio chitinivorans TaxID=3102792 RepID=UPI002B40682E|nr:SulA-like leucine-rich domain-containing protein [Cellvibrio sp. NN19]